MFKSNLLFARSLLTPEQKTDLIKENKHERSDFDEWYFDGRLVDAFNQVFTDMGRPGLRSELHKSLKAKAGCTKSFYHNQATFDNLWQVLDEGPNRENLSWTRDLRVASRLLREQLDPKPLVPRVLFKGMDFDSVCTNKDANVGAIGHGSKGDNEELCIKTALQIEHGIREGVSFSNLQIPAKAYHRSQISKYVTNEKFCLDTLSKKDRLVWSIDGGSSTLEATRALNIIDWTKRHWYNYSGISQDLLRQRINKYPRKHGISMDYSGFDHTVQWWVIKMVFQILKEFYPGDVVMDWIYFNFVNTTIIVPGDTVYQKHRGIPSGSMFTQLVGSMCNALMLYAYLSHCKGRDATEQQCYDYVVYELSPIGVEGNSKELSCFFMGDDSCVFTISELDLDDFERYVDRVFGMKMSAIKTETWKAFEPAKYLKREWSIRGEYRDPLEVAINTTHPERHEREEGYDANLYSEWHIMYGLFKTYNLAFHPLNQAYFSRKMLEFGGADRLLNIPKYERPGVFRAYSDEEWYLFVLEAKHYERSLSGT